MKIKVATKGIIERYLDYRLRLYIFKRYPDDYANTYKLVENLRLEHKKNAPKSLLRRMLFNRSLRVAIWHKQIHPDRALNFLLKPFE